MTDSLDLEKLKTLCAAATPGPWEVEPVKSDGCYGSGVETYEGFDAYQIVNQNNEVLFDSLNSTASCVEVEYGDEESGGSAWDEVASKNLEFVAAARTALPALIARVEAAGARIAAEAARRERAEKALKPFALIASIIELDYGAEGDDFAIAFVGDDEPDHGGNVTLRDFREAARVLSDKDSA